MGVGSYWKVASGRTVNCRPHIVLDAASASLQCGELRRGMHLVPLGPCEC